MKFSTITNPITAQTVKSIMSTATGNTVKNRKLIRKETAKINGFDSFEQAKSYFDRQERIENNLWVERNESGNIVVISRNIHVNFNSDKVIIHDCFKDDVLVKNVPASFKDMNFSDSDVTFNYKEKSVTLQNSSKSFKIVIEKTSDYGFIVSFFYLGSPITDNTIYLLYNDFVSNSNAAYKDQEFQVTRLMAEIAMTCEFDIKPFLSEYNLTEQDAKNILETSLYLFEKSKGYEEEDEYEIKPQKMFKQAMGYLAYIYLEHAYLHDTLGMANKTNLFKSMTIESSCHFWDLKAMAKNSFDWFRFSYCS